MNRRKATRVEMRKSASFKRVPHAAHMREELTLAALRSAICQRQPAAGLIHHTDRGGQYAGERYRAVLRRAGMRQSMSRADNCYDNASMESCFGTVKRELQLKPAENVTSSRKQTGGFIRYYHHQRLHSSLDYQTPASFERAAECSGKPCSDK